MQDEKHRVQSPGHRAHGARIRGLWLRVEGSEIWVKRMRSGFLGQIWVQGLWSSVERM